MKDKELLKEKAEIFLIHLDIPYNFPRFQYSLGLLYLATVLKEAGFSVKCLPPEFFFYTGSEQIEAYFKEISPRLVGFYTLADNIFLVKELSIKIKKWLPRTAIVLGGAQASVLGKELLTGFPAFDFAIKGEGEAKLLKLAQFLLRSQGSLARIPDLVFRHFDQLVINPPGEFIEPLDQLPVPDLELIGGGKNGFQVSTARGCPYGCTFCFQAVHGKKVRFRSPQNVLNEITQKLKDYSPPYFTIVDDTFILDAARTKEILQGLIVFRLQTGRNFLFFCQGRVEVLDRHPELLPLLKKAGLDILQIGIESGDQRTLDCYRKGIKLEQVEQVVKNCAQLGGISVEGNFILGGPFETPKTLEKSLQLAKGLLELAPGAFECDCGFLAAYPGTEIYKNPEKFGLTVLDSEFAGTLSLEDCHCETEHLNCRQLRNFRKKFYRQISEKMLELAPNLPRKTWQRHHQLCRDYGLQSAWYRIFLSFPALVNFFLFYDKHRFAGFAELDKDKFPLYHPIRTIPQLNYSPRGGRGRESLELSGSFFPLKLTHPAEVFIYRLCGGKLNNRQIAEQLKTAFSLSLSLEEIYSIYLLPLFKKLEEDYHLIFYL